MATKTPGVYLNVNNETEFTNPTATVGTTVAIIGFARKGPINEPTEITSYNNFKTIFGTPIEGYYSGLAIKNILSAGGAILFTRVADENKAKKGTTILKTSKDAVDGSIQFDKTEVSSSDFNYENGQIYGFKTMTSSGTVEHTAVVRAPAVGKLKTSEIINQITEQLQETQARHEFQLSTKSITGGYGSFKLGITTGGTTTYKGPFFTTLLAGASGSTIADNIGSAIYSGSYVQKLIFNEYVTNIQSSEAVKSTSKTFSFTLNIGQSSQTYTLTLTTEETKQIEEGVNNFIFTQDQFVEAIESILAENQINIEQVEDSSVKYIVLSSANSFSIVPATETAGGKLVLTEYSIGPSDSEGAFSNKYSYNPYSTTETVPVVSGLSDESFEHECFKVVFYEIRNIPDTFEDISVSYNENSNSIIFECINTDENLYTSIEVVKEETGITSHSVVYSSNFIMDIAAETSSPVSYALDYQSESDYSIRNRDGVLELYIPGSSLTPTDIENYSTDDGMIAGFKEIIETTPVAGQAAVLPSTKDMIIFEAREYGEGSANVAVEVVTTTDPLTEAEIHTINTYVGGVKKETWEDVSYTVGDDEYFATLINASADNGGSSYIRVNVNKVEKSTNVVRLNDTTEYTSNGLVYIGKAIDSNSVAYDDTMSKTDYNSYDYIVGDNGIPDGDSNDLFLDALSTTGPLSNKDLYSFDILITPDNIDAEVQNAAIELCETNEDAIYIADPPSGGDVDSAVSWCNGGGTRGTSLTSDYAAVYAPWGKVYDSFQQKNIWVMPSVFMAAIYCLVDGNYGPWYAPAGTVNGVASSVQELEYYPNRTDREKMYLNGNRVNPLIMTRDGTVMAYGEKTCARKESTLTKIHTRRAINALYKRLSSAISSYIFLPTVSENITKINSIITNILETYKTGGAISWYSIVCDGTNNTTETLQQDIVYADVVIIPNGCIEQVEINLTATK